MKKIILALMLLISITSFTKQYTDTEKRELLKQFKELQTAVKNRNTDKLFDYIKYPVYSPTAQKKYTKAEMKEIYLIPFSYTDMLTIDAETLKITPISNYIVSITKESEIAVLDITADFISKDNIASEYIFHFFPEYDGNGLLVTVTAGNDSYGSSNFYVFDLINGKLKLTTFFQIP